MRITGSTSTNGPKPTKPKKTKTVKPSKTTPKGKVTPKSSKGNGKGAANLPGYKVPKTLTKNNRANRLAGGGGTFADVKWLSAQDYKKQLAQSAKPTPAQKQQKTTSDWDQAAGWVDSQYGSLGQAAGKVKKKKNSIK